MALFFFSVQSLIGFIPLCGKGGGQGGGGGKLNVSALKSYQVVCVGYSD